MDFVLACLRADKHVLCEKPLAPTAEASLAVVEAEAALGRRLVQVAFMRRYDLRLPGRKERLDAGAIGLPLLVHCAHRNASVPDSYTTEMLFTSSATHEVDVTRWFLGREIVAATVHEPALHAAGAARACATRSSSCWRRTTACSSTWRCSPTRSTATTSAARSSARPAR